MPKGVKSDQVSVECRPRQADHADHENDNPKGPEGQVSGEMQRAGLSYENRRSLHPTLQQNDADRVESSNADEEQR
jgi:hypothetical protein